MSGARIPAVTSGSVEQMGDGQVMALLQPGEAAEVGQALAFFLDHVIAVGQVRRRDGGEPAVAVGPVPGDLGDRVPDVIVVADGVQALSLCRGQCCPAQAALRMPNGGTAAAFPAKLGRGSVVRCCAGRD